MDPNFRQNWKLIGTLLKSLIVFACLMEACFSMSAHSDSGIGTSKQMTGATEQYHPARRVHALQFHRFD
jgi:hypothetical protein